MADRLPFTGVDVDVSHPRDENFLRGAINTALGVSRYPADTTTEIKNFKVDEGTVDTDQVLHFGSGYTHGDVQLYSVDGLQSLAVTNYKGGRLSGTQIVVEPQDRNAFILPLLSEVLLPAKKLDGDQEVSFPREYDKTIRYLAEIAGVFGEPSVTELVARFALGNIVSYETLVANSNRLYLGVNDRSDIYAKSSSMIRTTSRYKRGRSLGSRAVISASQTLPIVTDDGYLEAREYSKLVGTHKKGKIEIEEARVSVGVIDPLEPTKNSPQQAALLRQFLTSIATRGSHTETGFTRRMVEIVKTLQKPD